MNVIRELTVNGMCVQEVEDDGKCVTYVDGHLVIEDYLTCIRLISARVSAPKRDPGMERFRELYGKEMTRRTRAGILRIQNELKKGGLT